MLGYFYAVLTLAWLADVNHIWQLNIHLCILISGHTKWGGKCNFSWYTNLQAKSKDWEVCFPAGAKASPVPIDPEELRKQEVALKIKQEYFSALKHEGMLLFGLLTLVGDCYS